MKVHKHRPKCSQTLRSQALGSVLLKHCDALHAIKEFRRILKPGGTFILYEHDCYSQQWKDIVELKHILFDAVINKTTTWEEYDTYSDYRSAKEWKKLIGTHFKLSQSKFVKNNDNSFYTVWQ